MNEILQCLEAILRQGYSSFEIFNDWLDLMLLALQGNDPAYLEIVNKYKNNQDKGRREIDYFCKAFGLLQQGMKDTNDDILGLLYMDWNQCNKFRGQFFTPKHVASMMAHITAPKGGRILDPCCGSGIMLVESIKIMTNEELDKATFYGQDIDLTCVKMCALNLLFFNVNGFIVWGDSLLMECRKVYQTQRSYLGGSIRELTGDVLEAFQRVYLPSIEKTFTEHSRKDLSQQEIENLSTKGEQLSFF